MSIQQDYPKEHEQQIVEALQEKREQLEEIAATETAFAPRAKAALEWLDEHTEESDAE